MSHLAIDPRRLLDTIDDGACAFRPPPLECCPRSAASLRARNEFVPLIQRERAAASLERSWRCARARRAARRRRDMRRLAVTAGRLVRGFLAREAARRRHAERHQERQRLAVIRVSVRMRCSVSLITRGIRAAVRGGAAHPTEGGSPACTARRGSVATMRARSLGSLSLQPKLGGERERERERIADDEGPPASASGALHRLLANDLPPGSSAAWRVETHATSASPRVIRSASLVI